LDFSFFSEYHGTILETFYFSLQQPQVLKKRSNPSAVNTIFKVQQKSPKNLNIFRQTFSTVFLVNCCSFGTFFSGCILLPKSEQTF